MLHASLQIGHAAASSITHLRELNNYVVGALGPMEHANIPRQAGAGAVPDESRHNTTGVSSFAFQVRTPATLPMQLIYVVQRTTIRMQSDCRAQMGISSLPSKVMVPP